MFESLENINFWDNKPIEYGYLRNDYVNNLVDFLDNSLVKVLPGQRRVGKSYLLRMLITHLINVKKNTITEYFISQYGPKRVSLY